MGSEEIIASMPAVHWIALNIDVDSISHSTSEADRYLPFNEMTPSATAPHRRPKSIFTVQ